MRVGGEMPGHVSDGRVHMFCTLIRARLVHTFGARLVRVWCIRLVRVWCTFGARLVHVGAYIPKLRCDASCLSMFLTHTHIHIHMNAHVCRYVNTHSYIRDGAMHYALMGECVKVAEAGGPECSRSWAGVEWMARVLHVMQGDSTQVRHASSSGAACGYFSV